MSKVYDRSEVFTLASQLHQEDINQLCLIASKGPGSWNVMLDRSKLRDALVRHCRLIEPVGSFGEWAPTMLGLAVIGALRSKGRL